MSIDIEQIPEVQRSQWFAWHEGLKAAIDYVGGRRDNLTCPYPMPDVDELIIVEEARP